MLRGAQDNCYVSGAPGFEIWTMNAHFFHRIMGLYSVGMYMIDSWVPRGIEMISEIKRIAVLITVESSPVAGRLCQMADFRLGGGRFFMIF